MMTVTRKREGGGRAKPWKKKAEPNLGKKKPPPSGFRGLGFRAALWDKHSSSFVVPFAYSYRDLGA